MRARQGSLRLTVVLFLVFLSAAPVFSAAPTPLPPASSGGLASIDAALQRLGQNRRLMIIGAHPDDEDNTLLGLVSRVEGVDTAYLALTRGEGGQNLIGDELGPALGVLRSEELLAARRVDRARQLFTRAYDFGFTESMQESFGRWPRQELLLDVVRAVRRFRPQVVIAVFPPDERAGHGQHQVSGALAEEMMKVVGDASAFPELAAEGLAPWQPQVFIREAWWDPEHADIVLPTNVLDPWTGRTAFQLGVEARSQHRSQSQGAVQSLEGRPVRLSHVSPELSSLGGPAAPDLFAGVDTGLQTLAMLLPAGPTQGHVRVLLADVERQVSTARATLGPAHLDQVTAALATVLRDLGDVDKSVSAESSPETPDRQHLAAWVAEKRELAAEALASAAGLVLDATVERGDVVPGASLAVSTRLENGGGSVVRVRRLVLESPAGWSADVLVPLAEHVAANAPATTTPGNVAAAIGTAPGAEGMPDAVEPAAPPPGSLEVPAGVLVTLPATVTVAADAPPTVPYFLAKPRIGDLYDWSAVPPAVRGEPFEPPPLRLRAELEIASPGASAEGPGEDAPLAFTLTREVLAVSRDLALGEVRRPLRVVPPVEVALGRHLLPWPLADSSARSLAVTLTANGAARQGRIEATVPEGWPAVTPVPFQLSSGETRTLTVSLLPPPALTAGHSEAEIAAVTDDGQRHALALPLVDYPHVRPRPVPVPSRVDISAFPLELPRLGKVGYVRGAADQVPEALLAVGVPLELLTVEQIRARDLSSYDAIVIGSRAYDAAPELASVNDRLLDYARGGGLLLMQVQRTDYFKFNLAPLPMSMTGNNAARTTDENAPVRLLAPEHPALNTPNAIGPSDWEGWVQERGLYYPTQWDPGYTPLLAMADPDKPELSGALLVAPVGKGTYVYTGLAFFRELPAGVPGAYRLFANLLGLAKPQVQSEDLPESQ